MRILAWHNPQRTSGYQRSWDLDSCGLLSGEGPVPVRLGLVSTGIDPVCRGLASLEGPPSLLSQWSEWSLQGLTCEKKTKSILVKAANLYSK